VRTLRTCLISILTVLFAAHTASIVEKDSKTKNEAKFDQAFDEMNAGCNRCHGAADRAFILIRRPSYPSAFSNQQYSPRLSERQK
jgi:cytochrome c553